MGDALVESASQKVSYENCLATVSAIFAGHGLPAQDAARVAECLLEADLRGLGSHGVSRIPIYTKRLRLKAVNPNLQPEEDTRTPDQILDIIEAKAKEIAGALALLRGG